MDSATLVRVILIGLLLILVMGIVFAILHGDLIPKKLYQEDIQRRADLISKMGNRLTDLQGTLESLERNTLVNQRMLEEILRRENE